MRLDYDLSNVIDNYKGEDGFSHYDYVRSEIWLSKQELCDEVSKFLGVDIPIETNVIVTMEQMESVHKLLFEKKTLIGVYGDEFLNEW